MSVPLTRPAAKTPADAALLDTMPLFAPTREERQTTSQLALSKAAPKFGERHARITQILDQHGPLPIFRVAELLGVPEHTISGRFSELRKGGVIERTGERVEKPFSGSKCDVYRVQRASL